jgi:3-hydroxyisobutyrate dehydrogenase-like beta-hydroxyacid dehydrogenase
LALDVFNGLSSPRGASLQHKIYHSLYHQGIRIGEKAGIAAKYLLELLNDTGAESFHADVRGPWIAAGDFKSRFGLGLALKNVRLGCETAKAWGNGARTT